MSATPYPTVRTPYCRCGHALTEHRIDLGVWSCGRGCGIPELQCPCEQFREQEDR